MTGARFVRHPLVLLVVAISAPVFVLSRLGPEIAKWTMVGLVGTAGYLYGTWLGIRLASGAASSPRLAGVLLAVVFLLKVPPIVVLASLATRAAPEVRDGLLYGAAVVYCYLAVWGLLPGDIQTPKSS